ncbi:unnamed protein product, partial [Ectocarpus sp. 12 AP-2014]
GCFSSGAYATRLYKLLGLVAISNFAKSYPIHTKTGTYLLRNWDSCKAKKVVCKQKPFYSTLAGYSSSASYHVIYCTTQCSPCTPTLSKEMVRRRDFNTVWSTGRRSAFFTTPFHLIENKQTSVCRSFASFTHRMPE